MIRELGSEVVALDTRANLVHQLNETASLVWRRKTQGRAAAEIAAELASTYAVDASTASQDVAAIIAQFEAKDLLARE